MHIIDLTQLNTEPIQMQLSELKLNDGTFLCGFMDYEAQRIDGFVAMRIKNDKNAGRTTYIRISSISYITVHDADAEYASDLLREV